METLMIKFQGKKISATVKFSPLKQIFYRCKNEDNVLLVGIRVQVLLKQVGPVHIPFKESRDKETMTKPNEPEPKGERQRVWFVQIRVEHCLGPSLTSEPLGPQGQKKKTRTGWLFGISDHFMCNRKPFVHELTNLGIQLY